MPKPPDHSTTAAPGFCRLSTNWGTDDPDTAHLELPKGADAAAVVRGGSLAYLTHVKIREETESSKAMWEFVVHAFGPRARALADVLAEQVRAWDRDVRHGDGPRLTVHTAGTPDAELPAGHVLRKPHSCLVFDRTPHKP